MIRKQIKQAPALALALVLPLLLSAPALAQQDTTSAPQGVMRRGMHRRGVMGPGMLGAGRMGAGMMGMGMDHVGPAMLINLRSDLGLSDQQVEQLTKIRDDHHSQMQGMRQSVIDLREKMMTARSNDDWSALEKLIDQGADLHASMAKSMLNVERQSLGVLGAEQRQKLETWQEGARVFRRGRMQHWMDSQGRGMRPRRRSGR